MTLTDVTKLEPEREELPEGLAWGRFRAETAIFRDGVLVSGYRPFFGDDGPGPDYAEVYLHEDGDPQPSGIWGVIDEQSARLLCVELAAEPEDCGDDDAPVMESLPSPWRPNRRNLAVLVLGIVAGDAIGNCISFTAYRWIDLLPWLKPDWWLP